jgi:anaerobic selenocysteine-containing dehydrogenase
MTEVEQNISDVHIEHPARIVKSNCHYCGYLCGFLATVEDTPQGERLVDLTPDPTRYPYSESIARGCRRWRMNLEQIAASERINYPLKRVGKRGGGQWQRVTWNEALDDIAARLSALAKEHGPQTLASAIGGPHASFWPLHRFLSLFGTPNNMGIGQICWNPRIWMDCLTYGWPIEVQIDQATTKTVFLWGTNPADSDNLLFWRNLCKLSKSEVPLVVVDPRKTRTAKIATLHLAPRPGTDCTLALALIREIIAQDRIDHDFIQKWCHGFEELKEHVQPYTLEHAERVTGICAADIAKAAHLFSNAGPSALLSGRGIDQLGANTAPTHRALSILRAITGDVDRAGACLIEGMSDFIPEIDLEMSARLTPECRATQLNIGHCALQSYPGYSGATQLTERFQKRLPMRYLTSAHPYLVWQAAITGEPYRVSALICMAANPLVTYADTHLVHKAFHALDLVVVLEYYLTPTAQLADYVLPIAGAFERPLMQAHGGVANFCYGGAAAVAPYYERRTDYDVLRELGCRLGQEEHWPETSLKEAMEVDLAAAGVNWQQWIDGGVYSGSLQFSKHEQYLSDGSQRGFSTTTGKIELANEYLESLGAGRLPVPVAVATDDDFPLTLITGARMQPYWASSYFNNPDFRKRHPDPTVQMSEATREKLGLEDGQWLTIETRQGSARFKAEVAQMVDGVLSAEYGWWYPEGESGEPVLSGIWQSNVNVLTSCDIQNCEPLIGSWAYNAIPCKISPL